jgi:hypothetical protein
VLANFFKLYVERSVAVYAVSVISMVIGAQITEKTVSFTCGATSAEIDMMFFYTDGATA